MSNEKYLEKKLREGIEKMGGIAFKFVPFHVSGIPDRIILMPGGRVSFCEVKSTGQKPKPLQILWQSKLEKLGFDYYLVDSPEALNKTLENERIKLTPLSKRSG